MEDITFFTTPRKHDALGLIWETLMESFAQLFEESLKNVETRPGSMVKGTVVAHWLKVRVTNPTGAVLKCSG